MSLDEIWKVEIMLNPTPNKHATSCLRAELRYVFKKWMANKKCVDLKRVYDKSMEVWLDHLWYRSGLNRDDARIDYYRELLQGDF